MKLKIVITLVAAGFIGSALPIAAEEHPAKSEHPAKTDAAKSEHPAKAEHPAKTDAKAKDASMADISTGIKTHITEESKKSSDGKMHVKYDGKDLALELTKVHDDRLSSLGDGKFFACVDMKATDGTVYDLDFFLSGQPGAMKVTETAVHKVSGKALYNWEEKDGTWTKVSAKS